MEEAVNSSQSPQKYDYDESNNSKVDVGKESNARISTLDSTEAILIALPLGLLILLTIIGNLFVIYAVATEKHLKRNSYKLIMSLAFADLIVALVVMPISAYYEIYKHAWILGPELCELWVLLDILFCSSSILHLMAIAIERYWSVTDVTYVMNQSPVRIRVLIGGAWSVATVVSAGPILGWKDDHFYERLEQGSCDISRDIAFQVFILCTTFYIPLICITVLYWNIFKQVRKKIRRRPGASKIHKIVIESKSIGSSENNSDVCYISSSDAVAPVNSDRDSKVSTLNGSESEFPKGPVEDKREQKIAKMLIIITGSFVCCWVPFFALLTFSMILPSFKVERFVYSIVWWLGYVNSLVNPIIYTVFSPDFRNAFKRILRGLRLMSPRY